MKNALKRYRISIDDESRLRRLVSASLSPAGIIGIAFAFLALSVLLGAVFVMATPLKTLLPGYLKRGERTATEKGLMRIDSIQEAYQLNSIYLSNILKVIDTDREAEDTAYKAAVPNQLPPDSLLPASPREVEYIRRIQDREKYNLSVLAPLAAEQLRTYGVGDGAVMSSISGYDSKTRVVMPVGSPVCALADGTVLTVQNPAPEGGSAIILQHDYGFASRYSHLGTVTVRDGDHVDGGEVIAHGARGGAISPGWILLEMWHDGTAIDPMRYVPM